jgi:hypothetical protein
MTNRVEKSQGVPNIVTQFSTCCIADFQIGAMREIERPAGFFVTSCSHGAVSPCGSPMRLSASTQRGGLYLGI